MKKVLSFEFYQQKCAECRDACAAFGKDSPEYKKAVDDMQLAWKHTKKPFLYKLINTIMKWQTKLQRY